MLVGWVSPLDQIQDNCIIFLYVFLVKLDFKIVEHCLLVFNIILTIYPTCLAQWPGEEACYVGDECTQFTTKAWDRKRAQAETSGGGNLGNSCCNFRRRFHISAGGSCENSSVAHPPFFSITGEINKLGGCFYLKLCNVCGHAMEQWKWTAPRGKECWQQRETASEASAVTLQPVGTVSSTWTRRVEQVWWR